MNKKCYNISDISKYLNTKSADIFGIILCLKNFLIRVNIMFNELVSRD